MIEIGINPVIFQVGPFALRWYSLLVLMAVLVVLGWLWREARRRGMAIDPFFTLALWALPGGIVGSRLVHVIDQLDFYLANPGAVFGGEGQAIYGAILGAALGAWLGCRVHRVANFPLLVDMVAPAIPLAHSVGRIANLINGDATGLPTSVPWAFIYTNPNTYAPVGVPTHPSPLYEILWNGVVFLVLFKLRGRLQPQGSLFWLYLAMYSLGRFFINFTRDSAPFLFGLHQAQVIALLVLAVSLFWLISRTRLARPEATAGSGEGESDAVAGD